MIKLSLITILIINIIFSNFVFAYSSTEDRPFDTNIEADKIFNSIQDIIDGSLKTNPLVPKLDENNPEKLLKTPKSIKDIVDVEKLSSGDVIEIIKAVAELSINLVLIIVFIVIDTLRALISGCRY